MKLFLCSSLLPFVEVVLCFTIRVSYNGEIVYEYCCWIDFYLFRIGVSYSLSIIIDGFLELNLLKNLGSFPKDFSLESKGVSIEQLFCELLCLPYVKNYWVLICLLAFGLDSELFLIENWNGCGRYAVDTFLTGLSFEHVM